MGKLSRRKGHDWEREVASRLRSIGIEAKRTLNETRDGNCGDLTTPSIPVTWQLKCGGVPPIYDAVKEAEAVDSTRFAVAAIKRNASGGRKPDELAVLPLDDFLEIVSQLVACGVWR